MFLQSKTKVSPAFNDYVGQIARLIKSRNGKQLSSLLTEDNPLNKNDLMSLSPEMLSGLVASKLSSFEFIGDLLLYKRSIEVAHNDVGALEMATTSLRKLTNVYLAEDNEWLFPVFSHVTVLCRKLAGRLDIESASQKWTKKLVEIYRELFAILHKERERLPGTAWLTCQLLHLFMALDQVKLCSHILAALSQSLVKEGGFDPDSVPRPIAVTLYYYWARFLVMDGKVIEAREKLEWAFVKCARHARNRRRIAEYLIPCMIATGSVPREQFIRECGLDHFIGLAKAIRIGDVATYNKLMEEDLLLLAQSGTLILMEKCKLICYRNLTKRVSIIMRELGSDESKLDLVGFEAAWNLLEGASRDELICALADLIYSGAVKGYLAPDHGKLVLSKASSFPPIASVVG